jgi:hypothetical protein
VKVYLHAFFDLGTRWWVVSFTPRPLYPQGKSPWLPLDRRLGGPQGLSGRGGEEKNSSRSESNPRTPIVQPVAQRYTNWVMFHKRFFNSSCSFHSYDTVQWWDRIPASWRSTLHPLPLHSEDGGSKALLYTGILPFHHTVLQPRRPQLECLQCKLHILHDFPMFQIMDNSRCNCNSNYPVYMVRNFWAPVKLVRRIYYHN